MLTSTSEVFCLMDEFSFDELWEGANVILIGRVLEKTAHTDYRALIYRVFKIQVERYYKNPLNESSVYVKVEGGSIENIGAVWAEDQPSYPIGQKVLTFLVATDKTHNGETLYKTYAQFQGKFKVNDGSAERLGGPFLNVTKSTIEMMKPANFVFVDVEIPANMTIREIVKYFVVSKNIGGQFGVPVYNISFIGISGPADGVEITSIARGEGAYPEGHNIFFGEYNFSKSGTYNILVDEEEKGNFTILEPWQIRHQYEFSNLKIRPEQAAVGERLFVSFNVSHILDEKSECCFRIKFSKRQLNDSPKIIESREMVHTFEGEGQRKIAWNRGIRKEGNYTVTVWYKGESVLKGKVQAVHEPEPEQNEDTVETSYIPDLSLISFLAGLLLVALLIRRRRS
jgi:hypothetical protein